MNSESKRLFSSFFMAGFECTYALNEERKRMDLLADTLHDQNIIEDYKLIKDLGITTAREGLSWSQIDKNNGNYDFSRFEPMMQAAKEAGIQQIWDLNHFDYPEYLDPFSQDFIEQFAVYGKECVKIIRKYQTDTIFIVPFNEISFFAWIAGRMGYWAPYKADKESELKLKIQLVKANIAVQEAIWSVDKNVRFIQVDPFIERQFRRNSSKSQRAAVQEYNSQIKFRAWDMLAGKSDPEIGGDPKYLDIIGINYYYDNQERVTPEITKQGSYLYKTIAWNSKHRKRICDMLEPVYKKYNRPLVITETGAYGNKRKEWWARILKEIDEAKNRNVPILGVCAYPVLDRPEKSGFLAANSGLWDFKENDPTCKRIPHEETLGVIKNYIDKAGSKDL